MRKIALLLCLLLIVIVACADPESIEKSQTPIAIPLEDLDTVAAVLPSPTSIPSDKSTTTPTASNNAASEPTITNTPEPTITDTPEPTITDTPEPTQAPTQVLPIVNVNASSVNLRSGPGTGYAVAGIGYQDDSYLVLGKTNDGNWFNVQAEDKSRAWVAASVVNEVTNGSLDQVGIVSTIPAPPLPTNPPAPTSPPATATIPPTVPSLPTEVPPPPPPEPPPQTCCKICSKGKACGDSCISSSYTCHKGPGCACNASIETGEYVVYNYYDLYPFWCGLSV